MTHLVRIACWAMPEVSYLILMPLWFLKELCRRGAFACASLELEATMSLNDQKDRLLDVPQRPQARVIHVIKGCEEWLWSYTALTLVTDMCHIGYKYVSVAHEQTINWTVFTTDSVLRNCTLTFLIHSSLRRTGHNAIFTSTSYL